MNERDLPHIVELTLPDGGFGTRLDDIEAFHRLRGINTARGPRQRRDEQEYVRWCFASVVDADDFAEQFGGARFQPRDTSNHRGVAALTFMKRRDRAGRKRRSGVYGST